MWRLLKQSLNFTVSSSNWVFPSSTSTSPLCSVCQNTIQKRDELGDRSGGRKYGTFVPHHRTLMSFQISVNQECHICTALWHNIPKAKQDALARETFRESVTSFNFSSNYNYPASLAQLNGPNAISVSVNLLDRDGWMTGYKASFVLQQAQDLDCYSLHTPAADNTRSKESWTLAMKWYHECTTNHSKCREAQSSKGWFPTRLIDIGSSGDCDPRLVITRDDPPNGSYVTLSHCWGSAKFLQLTCKSFDRLIQRISLSVLPKTFVDAIYVTRRLGFQYVWIDSLCITQDSVDDWLHEALLMHLVYANSMCNIAATGATDSSKGLFTQRSVHTLYPCEISTFCDGIKDTVRYHIIDCYFWRMHLSNAPLNQRAWVVQERFLAPRVLHFGAQQLFWECREFDAAEKYPVGLPPILKQTAAFKSFDPVFSLERMSILSGRKWDDSYAFNMLWNKIMRTYSSSQLTKAKDKLVALAGIATMLQSVMNDEYIAGLWKQYFASQLLWYVEDCRQGNGEPSLRQSPCLAPSWSWLSVDGVINGTGWTKMGILIDNLEIDIEPKNSDKAGPIKEGYIRFQGALKALRLERIPLSSNLWKTYLNGIEIFKIAGEHQTRIGPAIILDVDRERFNGELYCMSIQHKEVQLDIRGDQRYESRRRHLNGLVLEPAGKEAGRFRRLGLFGVTEPELIDQFLAPNQNGEMMPCELYDMTSHKHTICII